MRWADTCALSMRSASVLSTVMQITISKLEAAKHLLDRALDLYLDSDDPIAAMVLAGAAEDLINGLLVRVGRGGETGRGQLLPDVKALNQTFFPGTPTLPDRDAYRMMRSVFNWFRHSDDSDEPDPIEVDIDIEAEIVLFRAIENLGQYTGGEARRAAELVQARRALSGTDE